MAVCGTLSVAAEMVVVVLATICGVARRGACRPDTWVRPVAVVLVVLVAVAAVLTVAGYWTVIVDGLLYRGGMDHPLCGTFDGALDRLTVALGTGPTADDRLPDSDLARVPPTAPTAPTGPSATIAWVVAQAHCAALLPRRENLETLATSLCRPSARALAHGPTRRGEAQPAGSATTGRGRHRRRLVRLTLEVQWAAV